MYKACYWLHSTLLLATLYTVIGYTLHCYWLHSTLLLATLYTVIGYTLHCYWLHSTLTPTAYPGLPPTHLEPGWHPVRLPLCSCWHGKCPPSSRDDSSPSPPSASGRYTKLIWLQVGGRLWSHSLDVSFPDQKRGIWEWINWYLKQKRLGQNLLFQTLSNPLLS